MRLKMKAEVIGTDCEGSAFRDELTFLLIPPTDNDHYGTGYYMCVKFSKRPNDRQWVDVRYERTTDIFVLAQRYIESYYGKNAEHILLDI